MRRIAFFLLLAAWAVAMAQVQPGDEPIVDSGAPEEAVPCIPGEVESLEDDESAAKGEDSIEPCVEPSPETFPEEEPFLAEEPAGNEGEALEIEGQPEEEIEGVIDENILPTEASVEDEFKPGDEISEDYPVPLPADI